MGFEKRDGLWVPEAPQLKLSRTTEIEMDVVRVGIEGWFGWELLRGGKVVQSSGGLHRNLIVDGGMNAIGSGTTINNLINWCQVGTGTTAPATTDTALAAPLTPRTQNAGGFADVGVTGPSFTYRAVQRNRVFVESEVNGNLNEVSFWTAGTGGTMWCRHRFKDSGGADVTITKTSAEQLRVIYEWRIYPDNTVYAQTVSISGVSTAVQTQSYAIHSLWTSIIADLGQWVSGATAWASNVLPANNQTAQTGSAVNSGSLSALAYVAGTFYRDMSYVWEPGATNIGDYGSLTYFTTSHVPLLWSTHIATFNPKITKDATRRVTIVGRCHWARRP